MLVNAPRTPPAIVVGAAPVGQDAGCVVYERSSAMPVYFITDDEKVKIGYSEDPSKRLSSLQTGHPRRLKIILQITTGDYEEDRRLEKYYHNKFDEYRDDREWFSVQGRLAEFIRQFAYQRIGIGPVGAIEDTYWRQKYEDLASSQGLLDEEDEVVWTAQERVDHSSASVSWHSYIQMLNSQQIDFWKRAWIEEEKTKRVWLIANKIDTLIAGGFILLLILIVLVHVPRLYTAFGQW